SLDDIINSLTNEKWDLWTSSLDTTHGMHLYLPKFELEYEVQLKEPLSEMGMGVAFTDFADFTGINEAGGLMIDEVKHKTYVKVDEEGTEAAAATSVGVVITSLPPSFTVDKPFIVAIREKAYGSIIFIGKVMNPNN
ncbi:MAG TPA: serpin family protein, partial [Flavobacterium sp.]|nr:serpin family protein [Flavobacterium sp.]